MRTIKHQFTQDQCVTRCRNLLLDGNTETAYIKKDGLFVDLVQETPVQWMKASA
jgi:hypothetical protein